MQVKSIDNDPPHTKSIGRSQARRLELQRITQENQRLLKRIQETEPCYNHLEWEEDARKREQYIANMSEFAEQNMKIPMAKPATVGRKKHGQLSPLKSR
jgi:E3 ubiquitin-protein ligase TRIP12